MSLRITALVVIVLACGGCGAGDDLATGDGGTPDPSSSGTSAGSTDGSSGAASGGRLTIVVDDGSGKPTTWTLTCLPAGGTHPDPEAACAALAQGAGALARPPKDQVCTEIYGGPQTARITGTWGGKDVAAKLSRTNGCEISRWEALRGLLPPGGV